SFWLDQFQHMREAWPQLIGLAVRGVVKVVAELIQVQIKMWSSLLESIVMMFAKLPGLITKAVKSGDLGTALADALDDAMRNAFAPVRGFLKGVQGEVPDLLAAPSKRTQGQIEKLRGMFAGLAEDKRALEQDRLQFPEAGGAAGVGAGAGGAKQKKAPAAIELKLPTFVQFTDLQKQVQQQLVKGQSDQKKTADNTGKMVQLGKQQLEVQKQIVDIQKKQPTAVAND
ncbi:MAG: hypothetical protein ACPG75_03500, partial [Alloalcanivorax venustensis]